MHKKQNRLDQAFINKKGIFMPYVCIGDPNLDFSKKLIKTLIENGAGAIEFGIPFSDPIADGPVITAATNRALKNGMTPDLALKLLEEIRKDHEEMPIVVMTYYNLIYVNGLKDFVRKVKDVGADGLIVPDVPFEESKELHSACKENGLSLIQLVAPTTTDQRLEKIVNEAEGFIYIVSAVGITGVRDKTSLVAIEIMKKIRKIRTDISVAIGFGVSTSEQAKQYREAGADGIIVGSKLVNIYTETLRIGNHRGSLEEVTKFVKSMKN